MSWSNGRPEPEVIVTFLDGYSYNKNKMEEFFRSGFLDKPYSKPSSGPHPVPLKKEDVETIVESSVQFTLMQAYDLPKARAEKALSDAGGDVQKALEALSMPPSGS